MRRTIRWTLLIVGGVGLLPILVFGPGGLWGILKQQSCEGTVVAIRPSGRSESDVPERYLIELHTDDREVHVFPSGDPRWALMARGDRVGVRLFAAPPWSMDNSRWQDGLLMDKYQSSPVAFLTGRPRSETKSGPVVSTSSLAVSLMMLAIFVRSRNRRRRRKLAESVSRRGGR